MVERSDTGALSSTDDDTNHLRVTRRGFIFGSAAASAFFVDDVFAAETGDRRDRWLFSKNDDGPDRFVYKLTYFDGSGNAKQDLYFRERTFGVLARIEIRPADAADAQSGRIDLRLRISKATMLPESAAGSDGGGTRFFTFDFFFRHNAANGAFAPSIDIAARGWAFIGGLSTTKPWTLYEWIKEGRGAIPVSDAKPVAGDKTGLAARFAASIFGPIVEPGDSELCFLPQLNPDDRFLWRIKTAGEEKKDVAVERVLTLSSRLPDKSSGKADTGQDPSLTTIARASQLDIWREAPAPVEKKSAKADAGKKIKKADDNKKPATTNTDKPEDKVAAKSEEETDGIVWVEGRFPEQKPVGSIIRGAFNGAATAGPRVAVAGQDFGEEGGFSAVLLERHYLTVPKVKAGENGTNAQAEPRKSIPHSPVEFARWSTIIDSTGDQAEIAAARAFLSGEMSVLSGGLGGIAGPEFLEGKLPVADGELCVSTLLAVAAPLIPQPGDLNTLCLFPLAERTFTLSTSLGDYSAERPEKRVGRPGEKREPAPVVIRAKNFSTVTHFEAAVRIADASVALLEDQSTQPSLGASRGHFSRLDFLGGPEIALRLHGVPEPRIGHPGHILLATTNGLPLPEAPQPLASSLPMERALLRVLRYGDLADLRFRFAGLDLVNNGTGCVLRPRGPAVVARIVDPPADPKPVDEPLISANSEKTPPMDTSGAEHTDANASKSQDEASSAGGKKVEPLALPLTGIVVDPRPMIIVEFPPQHRAEQAFFQLRTVRPSLPKLPRAARETQPIGVSLLALHRAYGPRDGEVRLRHRADILLRLIQLQVPRNKDETEDDWKERWRTRWEHLAVLLKKRPAPEDKLDLGADQKLLEETANFLAFANAFAGRFPQPGSPTTQEVDIPPANFPAEQKLYAGPEFVDQDTQRYAELAQHAIEGSIYSDGNPLLDRVPVEPVSDAEILALKENLPVQGAGDGGNTGAVAQQVSTLRELRSPGYLAFSKGFDATFAGFALPEGFVPTAPLTPFGGADRLRGLIIDANRFLTNKDKEDEKAKGKAAFDAWWKPFAEKLSPLVDALPAADTGAEPPVRPVQSRLSGPTRLAFRVNTDDYDPRYATGEIPFTVDALTDFSRFELSVVRRAQKLLLSNLDGSRRPVWDAEADPDFAHMLVHQGFSRGGDKLQPVDARRTEEPDLDQTASQRRWLEERVTVDQRLAEVVTLSTEPPADDETSIELPFRLMLSPSQDALFRTPRGVPAGLFRPSEEDDSEPAASALWTAELDPESGAETRAIWSPDYRPEVFLPQEPRREALWKSLLTSAKPALPDFVTRYFPNKRSRANRAPLRGPYAPWAMGRHISSLNLSDAKGEIGDHRFRTSLDAFDRHELVALSSVHGLPVLGRISFDNKRIGRDQREPPRGFYLSLMGKPADPQESYDLGDIYVPRPFDPQGFELALSSLGGFLSVDASFEPPASIIDYERGTLFDALSIERWRHRIVLGRDISAEVVSKGYLMPLGIRASLIKSTERRFERIGGRGGPVAVLRQRMFIRIAKPEKDFRAFRQADDGRRVPFRKIQIKTLQTPDIVDPFDLAGSRDETGVWPGGLIDLIDRPQTAASEMGSGRAGTPFWPRTARRYGAEVMFEVLLDDKIRVRMPMIFVDNVTVNNENSLRPLADYYNLHGTPLEQTPDPAVTAYVARASLVQRPLFSQKLIFAPPENDGDTEFETETLTFAVEGGRSSNLGTLDASTYQPITANRNFNNDPYLNGADQPPFYPAMRRAVVHVKQIDRLTGQPSVPATVGYDTTYALAGFDPPQQAEWTAVATDAPPRKNGRDIFLALLKPLGMRFGNEGERGGAVARPQIDVVALSRSRGPIGNADADGTLKPAQPATPSPNPATLPPVPEIPPAGERVKENDLASFFGNNAKLLGIVSISDLLTILGKLLDVEPQLREIREYGGGLADDADAFIRDKVLMPIANALAVFRNRLENLRFNGTDGTQALDRVYPEVARTMAAFADVLDKAIAAPPPSSDADATIELYSSVYATGRRFSQAVERVTRDPLTPLREAVRGLVDDFVASLNKAVTEAKDKLIETYRPADIRKWAVETLQQQLLVPSGATSALANVIIQLPIPASELLAEKAQTHIEAAYAAALLMAPDAVEDGQKSPWSLKPGQPIFDLDTFKQTFFAKLKKAIEEDADGLETELKEQLKKWADNALKAKPEALQGALWTLFDEIVVAGLSKATDVLGSALALTDLSVDRAIDALEDVGVVLARGFRELQTLQQIAGSWTSKCQNVIDAADKFTQVVFPRFVADPKACIGSDSERDWVTCQDPRLFPPFYRLVGSVIRLSDAVAALVDTDVDKLGKLLRAVKPWRTEGIVDAAVMPLEDFYGALVPEKNKLRQDLDTVRLELVAIVTDVRSLQAALRKSFSDAAALCLTPDKLARALGNSLVQLERRRTDAIEQLIVLSGVLKTSLDFLWRAGITGVPSITKPDTNVEPAIDAAPKSWAWSDIPADAIKSADTALYLVETAKKDILATVLWPVTTSAAFLADVTALAALATVKAGDEIRSIDEQRDAARKELVGALAAIGIDHLNGFFASLSVLMNKAADTPFQKEIVALADNIGKEIVTLQSVDRVIEDFRKVGYGAGSIDGKRDELLAYLNARLPDLKQDVRRILIDAANDAPAEAAQGFENQMLGVVSRVFASAKLDLSKVLAALKPTVTAIVGTTADGFQAVLEARNHVVTGLPNGSASVNAGLTALLVACPTDPSKMLEDQLAAQTEELRRWAKTIAEQPADSNEFLTAANDFFKRVENWKIAGAGETTVCKVGAADGPNAVVMIFKQVTEAVETVVRGDFGRLVDIAAVRREVEAKLREMVPTRLTLAYDLDVDLKQSDPLGIFIPNFEDTTDTLVAENFNSEFAPAKLTLKARTYIDLLKPAPPKVDVSGSLGAFKVKLIGGKFDVLTLQFDGARFGSETGGKLKTNIIDFQLGKMVEFLDSISQYVSFGESGFFLSLRYDLPGIEAGYRMPPIYLTLGALNISNVSLNASCILPFSEGTAIFKVGLSRPEAPFSITSTIFGGCGHLALYASPSGIIGFSASLEFGAIVDFKLGPVTGRGQITAGVYIRSIDMGDKRVSTIEGVFTAAGSAKIAMFSIMAMLQVRVGQQASGGVAGIAIFVFSFSLGIKDIEFRFVIAKQEKKGFGGGGLSPGGQNGSMEPPTRFGALGIDPMTTGATTGEESDADDNRPRISSETACKCENFAGYMQYFSDEHPWILSS
ncbi:hypothetical protein ACCT00_31500 [Rhizobium ruizarguesonis]